jgi:tRNA (guanine37-N1)-methyltransferase
MRIDVFTLFPAIFSSPLRESLLGRAVAAGILDIRVHDIRDQTTDPHHQVDDEPFGGGPGMVMKAEPVFKAVESLGPERGRTMVLSPAGRRLDQPFARELANEPWLVLICGRYEGIDERVVDGLPAEEVSIGDFVLSGGELPALVLLEAVTRLVPGVIGKEESHERDSFGEDGILDHPHYTRPREFKGMAVPDVLLSGNHAEIERWRRASALEKTRRNRPDLVDPEGGEPG